MMNRRQILCSAAASAAMLAPIPGARAATYDLLIKGGRVIDPSVGLDGIRDVAIAGGHIVAVEAGIAGDATETIDAGGKIVAPGLIDIHTHAGRGKDSPALALQDGVTGFVDADSGGPDNIDEITAVVRGGPQIGRALINIATRTGFTGGELMDINRANVSLARGAIARNRDVIVGIKARLSENVAGINDLEGLRRAQEAASAFGLPVMIHIGQSVSPMRAILALLKRGDIVTHMYSPPPNSILDDQVACSRTWPPRAGAASFSTSATASPATSTGTWCSATSLGFWPDTLSTDWSPASRDTGVVDFPNVMSKFLMLGMPLSQVVACATTNAARLFDAFSDRGTLNIGAPADVAIMELRDGSFEFLDNYEGKRTGRQRLLPIPVLNGKRTPAR
jgi:dihydroorotase